MSKKPFYITTAIAYASKKPHIGNTYEVVFTDAVARYKRMQGYDVFFLTGTDEHGLKIEELAKQEGISPKEHVDKVVGEIKEICKIMNISYDGFIRTTDEQHEKVVQKIFKKLYDNGDIYKSSYEGLYCTPCESFWTSSQLVDGKCPDCGREVQPANEEAYFLRLSKYQQWLEDYIEEHPDFIVPESRKKEMLNNFIKPGLQDLCVSRTTFTWSIPVTFDPKHVIYVWIDALSNYITALGYDPDGSDELFNKYWPCDCHVIGKDIMRFHSIYWPIMLHALGLEIPKKLFGHNWILFGEDKMSKSRGNVIYANDVVETFGVDGARYYLLSEMPVNSDGSITYEALVERYNSDLANTLGNLVNRTVAMSKKYFNGEIMPPAEQEAVDTELMNMAEELPGKIEALMDEYRMADTMDAIMSLARRANKYIDETSPWVLAKDSEKAARLGTVLYNLLETIRFIGVALAPFLPETSEKILNEIGTDVRSLESLEHFGGLEAGRQVGEAVPLFARIDAEKFMAEALAAMEAKAAAAKAEKDAAEEITLAPEIAIDDFAKVEIRAAKVISCEKVKKSSKLLCLQLDDGMGGRQVVSGIAQYYKPEDLIGKTVQLIANLKPAKLCGVESCGMICAADTPDGVKVIFVDDSIPAGSKIR
ncbi:MAG: methionine--tRNA ligase [Oscillospiraceae bacterium]|nr:methionine--tRNA ligase [Ruminococcus sp.]MDD6098911.1 methionine--tRNA ligase [Oscillospiraceae bacterium]